MISRQRKKVVFFGCPLDCDEREEAVQEKHAVSAVGDFLDDPNVYILQHFFEKRTFSGKWENAGSIYVEEWLRPIPSKESLEKVSVKNFVSFLDADGCQSYIQKVSRITKDIYPLCPCLIGVDHCLSSGLLKALTSHVDPDQITLIILDSHTDALPISILSDLISYDIETNKESFYDPNDPFLFNRTDTINSSSFLFSLICEGVINPNNLYIIGVSDNPPKRSFRIKDQRVKNYIEHLNDLKRKGVKFITKKDLITSPSKIKSLLKKIDTPYLYISIDMDIGARNALNGVRFLNRQGINEIKIYKIVNLLKSLINSSIELIGMDITEFNPRKANPELSGGKDRTYEIAANIIKILCFGIPTP